MNPKKACVAMIRLKTQTPETNLKHHVKEICSIKNSTKLSGNGLSSLFYNQEKKIFLSKNQTLKRKTMYNILLL